jgi:uncharacterized protein DUF5074/type IX secretion system substrate protein
MESGIFLQKNKKMKKNYSLSVALFLISFACFSQSYLDGIFVLNEGNMGSNSASVSFITQDNQVVNNVFGTANNNAVLGDVGQSMNSYGENTFIVLNFSNAIKVVSKETFTSVAAIETGLINPRYMAFYQNKGYVTCWGDGTIATDDYIAVINLTTYQVESTIAMPEGVEHIEEVNGKLYVAHQGGYGYGTTLSIVDIATLNVSTIPVGDIPNSMVVKDNYLYVLCGGMPSWSPSETSGKLVKINLADNTIATELPFTNNQHPMHLNLEGNNLYYALGSDIYKMPVTDAVLPITALTTTPIQDFLGIYGLDVINNKIYVADANGFAGSGFAHIYNTDGTFVSTHAVGDIPNHFYESKHSNLNVNDAEVLTATSLYPNPATTTFYIKSNKNVTVTIYDFTGKVVKSEVYSPSGVDVSSLSKGIYIVEMSFENQKQISKLAIH